VQDCEPAPAHGPRTLCPDPGPTPPRTTSSPAASAIPTATAAATAGCPGRSGTAAAAANRARSGSGATTGTSFAGTAGTTPTPAAHFNCSELWIRTSSLGTRQQDGSIPRASWMPRTARALNLSPRPRPTRPASHNNPRTGRGTSPAPTTKKKKI
jgi:hypothetical protein